MSSPRTQIVRDFTEETRTRKDGQGYIQLSDMDVMYCR